MPEIDFRPTSRVRPDCAWLLDHRSDVTSQLGQDGILQKVFEVIGAERRYCVEFGAWDGRHLSNTWSLIAQQEWSGLLIEGDAAKAAEIKNTHPYDRALARNRRVGWEGADRLDAILADAGAPERPDLISMDVDGNEFHIWNALTKFRPRVVLVEFNPTAPNDVYFVQDAHPDINQGSSLLALIELAKSKGYSLVCALKFDAFFVSDELFPLFQIEANDIDSLYFNPVSQTRIFQGYDGTLYTAGNRDLVWKGVRFEADELQLLPRSMRRLF